MDQMSVDGRSSSCPWRAYRSFRSPRRNYPACLFSGLSSFDEQGEVGFGFSPDLRDHGGRKGLEKSFGVFNSILGIFRGDLLLHVVVCVNPISLERVQGFANILNVLSSRAPPR